MISLLPTINIDTAVKLLKNGECVAVPTETVYGLAGMISSASAIESIFKIKERPFFDPLIVHVSSINDVNLVAREFPLLAQKIAQKFWPGPLTLVLPKAAHVSPMITSGLETVAVRMPDHKLTLDLIKALGEPVAAPSANKFGKTSPTQVAHVFAEFGSDVPILDGGSCKIGIESTVIGFDDEFTQIEVYRPGAVTINMLREFAPVIEKKSQASPGQVKHHYQPSKPFFIVDPTVGLSIDRYQRICETLKMEAFHPSWVSLSSDPVLAARELYAQIRRADQTPHTDGLIIEYDMNLVSGVWGAITDRLSRAGTEVA